MVKDKLVIKPIKHSLALAMIALTLAACNQTEPQPPAEPVGDEADAPAPQSIIRSDVEPVAPVAVLTPLVTSISFADGGAQLSEGALAELATVRSSPQMAVGGPIILGGHSDAAGSDAANLRASAARAEAVAEWLVDMGVARDRITVIAFGEQNPVEPNAKPDGTPNEMGREANRRVEMTIALLSSAEAVGDKPDEVDQAASQEAPEQTD